MPKLPIRAEQFQTADFLAWLARNGAEVCTPTNPYELVRYRAYTSGATKAMTHIVYRKDNGLLTWTGASMKHYEAFISGAEFAWSQPYAVRTSEPTEPAPKKLGTAARHRAQIAKRDGTDCWFCGLPLGSDVTLEHLLPQSKGGRHNAANLVLAHERCNGRAANLSISEKVELRTQMRAAPEHLLCAANVEKDHG